MAIDIRPLTKHIGGEVSGIDIRRPLSQQEVAAIDAGMDRYAVLVFHGPVITDEEQLAFTLQFGAIQPAEGTNVTKPQDRRLDVRFSDVSNVAKSGELMEREHRRRLFSLGNRLWHSDASYRAVPAKYSMLSARVVPASGGNTEFADMRAAYDSLDDATKAEVEDLVCEHSLMYSRAQLGFSDYTEEERKLFAPVLQRLVRTHPVTGRKSLYLASHIGNIIGWQRPEALAFVRDLMEHATQPEYVYSHHWQAGDLVIWDNRQTMHRVRRFDDLNQARDVRRTTTKGDGPTVAQQAAA